METTTETISEHRVAIRVALGYLTATSALIAVWILVAPRSFYEDFPVPHEVSWVSVLPPYNEHLERDFGAYGLGLAVLTGLAAWWMDRRLVQAAAIVMLIAGLPHLAYHLTVTEGLSFADNLGTLGGLALQPLLAAGILYLARRPRRAPAVPGTDAGARPGTPG